MTEFLNAFNPDNASIRDRKAAFRAWASLAAQFDRGGYDVAVSNDMGDIRRFWEALPPARRAEIRMPPVQDVAYHRDVGPDDAVVVLATKRGERVPCTMIGARRIWLATSLHDAMEDLSFWYGAAAPEMREAGRICRVTAPTARQFESDHIAWLGGGMNVSGDPVVYRAAMRAILLYVTTHWRFKATVAIVERSTFRIHGFDWYGFCRNEKGVWRDDTEFLLASMPRSELVREIAVTGFDDVAQPLLGRPPERVAAPALAAPAAVLDDFAESSGEILVH